MHDGGGGINHPGELVKALPSFLADLSQRGLMPSLLPGAALPAQDVGGQDLADIPRFPGMVRVAYSLTGQKKISRLGAEISALEIREP